LLESVFKDADKPMPKIKKQQVLLKGENYIT